MSEQLYFTINAGLAKRGTPVLDSQPGAHTGATRKYIPGYSDANIVFWNDATGNDGNTGASIAQAVETYAQAATLAGSTKKIRKVNSSTVSVNITKPTEATIGTTSTIASSSLTAPVNVWTQSTTFNGYSAVQRGLVWVPWLSKFYATGGSSKLYSSPDGVTWTAVAGHGYGSDAPYAICISQSNKLIFTVGSGGKFGYSSDGTTFTVSSPSSAYTNVYNGIDFDETTGTIVICGSEGQISSSVDIGITWFSQRIDISLVFYAVAKSSTRWVVTSTADEIYYSDDSRIWTRVATSASAAWVSLIYSHVASKFVIGDESGIIYYSSNGTTWTAAATPSFGGSNVYGFAESLDMGKIIAVGAGGKIAYSSDANTFTQAGTPSYGASDVICAAWSPLLQKFCTGGNSKAAFSTAYATTISADVAGFSIANVTYSGTVAAYNCTITYAGTTAALSLDSSRVTGEAHISNNAAKSIGTLYLGDLNTTCTPAAQNDVDYNSNTIVGKWYIYNASATGYERIRDNIIEGGIVSTYAVTVTSGNTRGTSSGAVFSDECTQSDPKFVDETDYKLRREMDSYQYDSPLVAASQFYFNANGEARDLGAWSYNESTMEMLYTRHFPFLLPTGKDSFSNVLHSRVNRHVGEDGTPDVINDIDALWEEITLRYQTLPSDHIDFLDWWQGNFSDMTCEIDFFVGQPVSSTITVNGAHSAGDVTLTIDAGTTLAAGDRIFSGTEVYSVLYMVDDTLAVLSRKLAAGISDNAVLTISQPTGKGTYQYLPQADRDLRKPMGQAASEFDRGLVLNFSRKRV